MVTPVFDQIDDKYTLHETLGYGSSSKVRLAVNLRDNQQYALKIFRHDNPLNTRRVLQLYDHEVQTILQLVDSELSSRHVVQYIEYIPNAVMRKKDGREVSVSYIAQEAIRGGELYDHVLKSGSGGRFSESVCKFYFKQMLEGIQSIHSRGLTHRDVKIENILLDMNHNIKIVDFGLARPLEGGDGTSMLQTIVGTPANMAPEMLTQQPYYNGEVVDLFALGIVLFILYTGHRPFDIASEQDEIYLLIAANRSNLFWHNHCAPYGIDETFYSQDFKDLITLMFQKQPSKRLCIADIIGHPWLANTDVPIATTQQVRQEFNTRRLAQVEAEFRRITALREQLLQQAASGNVGTGTQLGVEDDVVTECEENSEMEPRTAKAFDENKVSNYSFFSTYSADKLWKEIKNTLQQDDKEVTMSENFFKLIFEVEDTGFANSGTASAQETFKRSFKAQIQVEILKVPGQEKHCVVFRRKTGSTLLFCDSANEYIDLLADCSNILLENEETQKEEAAAQQ